MPVEPQQRRLAALLGLSLVALTLLTFRPALDAEFVNFDDPLYVTANPETQRGLSRGTLGWAFSSLEPSNWQPLTLLSHALDVEIYGLDARGHHLTNLLLHAAAALALFAALLSATRRLWRSFLVAALFGVHPLHVESVAWVAQRKDVLSALFCFLVLVAYVAYSRRPSVIRYLLVTILFALGLLAKSMLVTLPIVLLLLDYWPLGRLEAASREDTRRLVAHRLLEKVPWLAMSAAVGVVTLVAQREAIASVEIVPPGLRLANALVSCLTYLEKAVVPTRLGPFYPMTDAIPSARIVLAAVLLLAATWVALRKARQHPYLCVGWLWYLVTLAPVIGLLQVGAQSHADRYTYIPLIGIFLIVSWGAADLAGDRPWRRAVVAGGSALVVCLLAVLAHHQTTYWSDSATLFRHVLAVTGDNPRAHLNLAEALAERRDPEAFAEYRAAIALRPDLADAHAGLGRTFLQFGHPTEAIAPLERALSFAPDDPRVRFTLARALAAAGREDEARAHLEAILQSRPDFAPAHQGLGVLCEKRGELKAALAHYRRALELDRRRVDLVERIRRLESRVAAADAAPNL